MELTPRTSKIRDALLSELEATHVQVIDHSADHAGHPGAAAGGGHFEVVIVSNRFEGVSRIAAQRLVYQALGTLMTTDIHALSMRTFTPAQWQDHETL